MKHLATILLLALCATASSQTIKSLGYNTTNGEVVYSGTNTLTFTNHVNFADTNVGLEATNFIGSYVEVGNYMFYSATASNNPIQFEDPATRTNFLHSLGVGPTNNVVFGSITSGSDTGINGSYIEFGGTDVISTEELLLIGNWQVEGSFGFNGTNIPLFQAQSRTNFGLPWSGLTNTNAATFQGALFAATNAAPTNTNAPTPDAWVDIQVGTNTYKLPLWQ